MQGHDRSSKKRRQFVKWTHGRGCDREESQYFDSRTGEVSRGAGEGVATYSRGTLTLGLASSYRASDRTTTRFGNKTTDLGTWSAPPSGRETRAD